jgi:cilla- and flagella-associated protein
MDLTEWEDNQTPHNGNHQNGHPQRRNMMSNGGSQDRYPEERRELYQYRNGNMSREDFGEEMTDRRREGRRDNGISNAVLNHLAGLHRRPVNRVSFEILFCFSSIYFD